MIKSASNQMISAIQKTGKKHNLLKNDEFELRIATITPKQIERLGGFSGPQ